MFHPELIWAMVCLVLAGQLLPQEVVDTAIKVNQQMLDVMVAAKHQTFIQHKRAVKRNDSRKS